MSYGEKLFSIAAVRKFNFEKNHISHVTVIKYQVCCCVPNFIEIRWFFLPRDAMQARP